MGRAARAWHLRRCSTATEGAPPMSQQHCHFDASKSLTALEQDSTIIAVIEMSQSKWLVAALVPGVKRHPLKLLHRWRNEAGQAGREIKRIVVAYEAGRDGFWLARWLGARYRSLCHSSDEHRGVARTSACEDRSPRYRTPDARLSWLVARREAPLQHGSDPDHRGGGREAAEPRAAESCHRANADREPNQGHLRALGHSHLPAYPAQGRGKA